MVELQNKYKIGVRKFGKINYVGFYSLWYRECSRFFIVWAQTLLSPLVSSLLFLVVLSLALGNDRNDVLGYSFIIFLAPGLIIQSMILQSFSHSVSSLMISKMQGNIIDILYAPLSSLEVTLAIILAAVTKDVAKKLYEDALKLNMSVIVEVHTKEEAKNAMIFSEALIGINNRNLKTLVTDINTTYDIHNILVNHAAPLISESGIKSKEELLEIERKTRIKTFLIGESLLKKLEKNSIFSVL